MTDDKVTYLRCESCIGRNIDNIHILSPCIRAKPEGFEFKFDCSKKMRGIEIPYESKWVEIEEDEFNALWDIGMQLKPRINIHKSVE